MELLRVILVITGVVLLGIAFLMGRSKKKANIYHRASPEGYDPFLDELNVPLAGAARDEEWQTDRDSGSEYTSDNDRPRERAGMVFDADAEISDEEIDVSLPSTGDYPIDPVQTEIEISKEFDEINLDVDADLDIDEVTERADAVKVTSLASAVRMAAEADDKSKEFGEIDLDVDADPDIAEVTERAVAARNFSEEFLSYGEGYSEGYGDPVQLEQFEEKLVSVHVAAQNDRRFYGSDLKAIFNQHGYTYGRMSIYHCALDGDKVFSIANMVKPGTFDDDQMDSFETPGLTLFMRLPIELDAAVAFDFLIREAKGLAEELGGHLRDGNRNPLSEQTIQHMREDIQQYVFRSQRALRSS